MYHSTESTRKLKERARDTTNLSISAPPIYKLTSTSAAHGCLAIHAVHSEVIIARVYNAPTAASGLVCITCGMSGLMSASSHRKFSARVVVLDDMTITKSVDNIM